MKKVKNSFAEVVSRVFDPVWEIPVAIILAIGFAVHEGLRWRFLGLILFIDSVVPFIFFLVMLYHGQIKDWDIQKRSERIPIYLFTLICHLGGLWLAHELGKVELVSVLVVFYVVAIIFFGITLKWKISLHMGMNAILFTAINVFYDWKYYWLYGFLFLVGWARVWQKHHSWDQVVAGAMVGGSITYIGLRLIGG